MDEAKVRRAALGLAHSRRASWLFLLGLLTYLFLPFPWLALGAAPAVAALIDQVKAFRAFGVIQRSAALRVMSAFAMVACTLLALAAVTPVLTAVAAPERTRCYQGANTAEARAACAERFGQEDGFLRP